MSGGRRRTKLERLTGGGFFLDCETFVGGRNFFGIFLRRIFLLLPRRSRHHHKNMQLLPLLLALLLLLNLNLVQVSSSASPTASPSSYPTARPSASPSAKPTTAAPVTTGTPTTHAPVTSGTPTTHAPATSLQPTGQPTLSDPPVGTSVWGTAVGYGGVFAALIIFVFGATRWNRRRARVIVENAV